MFRPFAFIFVFCFWHFCSIPPSNGQEESGTQVENSSDSISVSGLMTAKKKYSFSVSGSDRDYQFRLDSSTVIAARVYRPKFDWKKLTVQGDIPASAPDGRFRNNLKVAYSLSNPIYFRQQFDSAKELNDSIALDPIPLNSPVLTRVPLKTSITKEEKPQWSGELRLINQGASFKTALDYEEKDVVPTWSYLVFEGFSLLDLKPYETDVFVDAKKVDNKWIAKRIEFSPRQNLQQIFKSAKPKCLVVGDIITFNYMPALIKELNDRFEVQHVNENCKGSANHSELHRWIGDLRNPELKWDVIAFNFGQADTHLDKTAYQSNLQKCIKRLKESGAKLVWIESTPVPYGYNDDKLKEGGSVAESDRFDVEFENPKATTLKPGRMKLQNRWAKEVLASHPDIRICNTWDIVKDDVDGKFKEWWYGKNVKFKFPQSIPLAKAIAQSIVDAVN